MGALAFLDGALAWGLVAAAVPFVVHLISKRRARRVPFAALELLLKSQRRTARSIRLRQLLLLLVRTLLIAALALALARPVLRAEQAEGQRAAPLVVVVALDVSASMQTRLDGRTHLERARAMALARVRAEADDVRVGVVACDRAPRDVSPPSFDRAAAIAAIEGERGGHGFADLVACTAHAAALARAVEGDGERRVVVLSDLAAHGVGGSASAAEAAGVTIEWARVIDEEPPPNHALLDVQVRRTSGRSGEALQVAISAERWLGPAVDVPADLLVGGRRAARLALPLSPGRAIERSFHHATGGDAPESAPAGGARIAVSLEHDAFELDDQVELPFELPPPLKVIVVDGAPQALPFQDEVFYLETALRGANGGPSGLALEVVGPDQVRASTFAGARVVVLANVARLDDAAAAALIEHTRAGGGVLVSVGDQTDVEWANRALGELLYAPLRGSKGQALLDDASVADVLTLTRFRTEHPVLRGLAQGEELPGLGRVRTHTFMLMEPGSTPAGDVLVRFSNGAPALVERDVGDGRALLLLTSIDRDWSDLAIRPGFLPLVRQIALYLGGALDDGTTRLVHVGERAMLRVPRGVDELVVRAPSGRETTVRADGAATLTFADTDEVGIYTVLARTEGGEPRVLGAERFTALLDARESDPTPADADALARATPTGARSHASGGRDDDLQLWPFLFLAAAALVLVEGGLVRRSA
ncbi:MAG: BatA and WFA domain-containing protein [Deltaproteobacteria bacterium]|nr:BatA and WFA domain-containing protein [Deltaproteobacteria bacterium]